MAQTVSGVSVTKRVGSKGNTRALRHTLGVVLTYLVLTVGAITVLVPFYSQIATSLKDAGQIAAGGGLSFPNPAHWHNYIDAFTTPGTSFNYYFLNTILIEIGQLSGTLLTTTMAAYAFARLQAPFKDQLFFLVLALIAVPGVIMLIPQYFIYTKLHLTDTLWPLIIPAWLGGAPSFIFLLRQFFLGVPGELGEAAVVDGAGTMTTLFRIYVPLAKPALAAVAIFVFIGQWHDFLAPLIYLSNEHHFTLTLGINQFVANQQSGGGQSTTWNLLQASSMAIVLPPLLVFLFFQRFFIEGITLGGVKG
jgi:multiple sugar transport system permease protein